MKKNTLTKKGRKARILIKKPISTTDHVSTIVAHAAQSEYDNMQERESELKQLQDELRESEQRFHATFEQFPIGIAHIGFDGRWLRLNQKLCDIVGYTREELLDKTFHVVVHPDDLQTDLAHAQSLLHGEMQTYERERRYVCKDGSIIWVHMKVTILHDSASQPQYFIATIEDITERMQTTQRTHDALNALLAMAESLVLVPDESDIDSDEAPMGPTADPAVRHLARLTCRVLGCRSVGLLTMEPQTEVLSPVAVAGVTTEHKRMWWTTQEQQQNRLSASFTHEQIEKLRANEVLVFDMEQPQLHNLLAPHYVRVMLVAPMMVSDQLIGVLILDHGDTAYICNAEEVALARAVARLAALVIERKRLLNERATAQAGEIAQRDAKRHMEEFLGIASHEFRTPITTINVNIQVAERLLTRLISQQAPELSELASKGEAVQEMLRSARRQVEMLSRLVSDLIDISRIQANKLELHLRPKPCDLTVIVQEVVQNQQKITSTRNIRLSMSSLVRVPRTNSLPSPMGKDESLVPIIADPDRIGQVVTNYLTNAIKFSPADRPVEVRLQVEGGTARVSVRDQGPGLSPAEQEHIWQRFYQGKEESANSGLGLGLYISRSLIERQQGQVGVQSALGEGSTFWFTLPLAQHKK